MIVLSESLFSKEEIEFIKWYDEIRGSGKSYEIPEKFNSLIRCLYGGDEYINKIDLELKIIKADKN